MKKMNFNGKIQMEGNISALGNRAFLFGDAVFETLRILNGEMCNFNQHYERLEKGMETLQIDINDELRTAALFTKAKNLIKENKISKGGYLRITVFRSGGYHLIPENNEGNFLIETTTLDQNYFQLNEEGLKIGVYIEGRRKRKDILNSIRTTNSMNSILAILYAKETGLDECVILNDVDRLCQAIDSNIFLYKDNTLYTPKIEEGCLPGIMRRQIINIGKERGLDIVEGVFTTKHLLQADEIFLTNSIDGIKWVMSFQQKRYFNKISSMLLKDLNQFYTKE